MELAQADAAQSRIQTWFARRSRMQRYGISFVAGMLATLGQAPFQIVPAYVVAIVILVWLLDATYALRRRRWAAASTAWWFALGHYLTGYYWITSAFLVDADMYGALAIPALLAFAGGLALFWMLGGALAISFWTKDARRIPAFAVAFLVSEWLRGHVFGGFPWILPGYIWTPGEPLSQLASVFGIYGLSAITLLICAAPATIADGQTTQARRFGPPLAAALAFGLAWGWGAQRLAHAPVEAQGDSPVVRVADSGLGQAEKWRDRYDQEEYVLHRYLDVSGDAQTSHADVVIWPEGAIPTIHFLLLDNPQFLDEIGRGLGDRALVMGFTRCEPRVECEGYMQRVRGSEGLRFYNSATIIDGVAGHARVDPTQIYDKHHLVPWGEFIPFWSVLKHFNLAPLQEIGAGFTPGAPPTRLVVPGAPSAIILICYEAVFPDMTPRGDERPGWIIVVSNDAWFGNLKWFTGPWQHYAAARYRSIEEGLPMARAASGGISGIIDSLGRAVRETHPGGQLYAEAQLPPSLPPTAYARWGVGLFPLLVVAIAALRFAPLGARAWGKQKR